jgi:hypothetical protein
MPTTPSQRVFKKSNVGLIYIYLGGAAATVLLLIVAFYLRLTQPNMTGLLLIAALVVILATGLSAYSYGLSRLILTKDCLIVRAWNTFLFSDDTVTLWEKITDVNVIESGILAQIFNYGKLSIEAESGDGRMVLTFVPNPSKIRDLMIKNTQNAAQLVKEQ